MENHDVISLYGSSREWMIDMGLMIILFYSGIIALLGRANLRWIGVFDVKIRGTDQGCRIEETSSPD
jgi:hypothetical protein